MYKRTQKACQLCGKIFYGTQDKYYCSECAKIKKKETVLKNRTCQECGCTFLGGPRAKRCPNCACIAQREADRRHKKNGTLRLLGSVDYCQLCGKPYVIKSGRQKYCCEECQHEAVLILQRKQKSAYNKLTGQNETKKEKRERNKKICIYCGREFKSHTSTNVCSDYCRKEQRAITQCMADIKRGYKRNLDKYLLRREQYRDSLKKI